MAGREKPRGKEEWKVCVKELGSGEDRDWMKDSFAFVLYALKSLCLSCVSFLPALYGIYLEATNRLPFNDPRDEIATIRGKTTNAAEPMTFLPASWKRGKR